MKFIDRVILCIFSILILVFAILFSCVIFGWLDLTTIYILISNALQNQVTCNVLIGVNIVLILMSLKGIFFESNNTEEEYSNDGILLQNEDGKLLITRDTITSIVNSVVSGFESVKDADTKINLSDNNDLLITLNIEVDENAVIKELSNNIQIKVKDAIKKSIDVDVKSLDIRVKDMVQKEDEQEG